jgi:tetratricopeptide (TPR) repeat protein
VLFWLAEQAFNSGDFAEAERQFLRIYMDYQSHALSEKALYQAGRAAMRTRMFTVAIERFSELVRVYPKSSLLPQARFSQGDALTELGEHARAILAFEEVLKNFPQHALSFAAQGRVADCQFALGADQPERYQVAFEGYRALLERVNLDRELKLQSLYKMGRCAQKMDRPDEAFEAYMQVVYSFLSEGLARSSKNLVWFTRAGFAAAALQADLENPSGAIAVYDRMVEAAVPASKEAHKRADVIRDRLKSVGQKLE